MPPVKTTALYTNSDQSPRFRILFRTSSPNFHVPGLHFIEITRKPQETMFSGVQVLITEWSLIFLCFLLIVLRLYIRLYTRRIWSYSDIFVVLGWLCFVGQVSLDTYLLKLGYYKIKSYGTRIDISVKATLGPYEAVQVFKVQYIESGAYYFTMYCVKGAILDLYFELIPEGYRKTRIFLKITVGMVAFGFVISTAFRFLFCWPIPRNWSLDPKEFCTAGNGVVAGGITLLFHIITDFILYILPFPVLKSLNMRRRQKVGVGIIFGTGFLCIVFAIAVVLIYVTGGSTATGKIFTGLEQTYAIVVVCLPSFKTFLTGSIKQALKRFNGTNNSNPNSIREKKPSKLQLTKGSKNSTLDGTLQTRLDDSDDFGGAGSISNFNRGEGALQPSMSDNNIDLEMNSLVLEEEPGPSNRRRRPSYALLPPKPLMLVPFAQNSECKSPSSTHSGRLTPLQVITPQLSPGARVIIPE